MHEYGHLTKIIMRLAARECGMHSANPEFEGYTTGHVGTAANKLVARGTLFRVKLAHKEVRYYTDPAQAARVERNVEFTKKAGAFGKASAAERMTRREGWAEADMVITDKTVFTQCPNYTPQFQSFETPNVYGGNQRGRVTL